jgi:hypothetical protein
MLAWLPLVLDATESGDLLFAMPSAGFLAGVLPVRWFPAIAPAQVAMAAATLLLLPRRTLSSGWLVFTFFGLALLLNLALWLQERRERSARDEPATTA